MPQHADRHRLRQTGSQWSHRSLVSRIKLRASVRTGRCLWPAAAALWAAGTHMSSEPQWSGPGPALLPAPSGNSHTRVSSQQRELTAHSLSEGVCGLEQHVNTLTFMPLLSVISDAVGRAWVATTDLESVSSKTTLTEVVPTSIPRTQADMAAQSPGQVGLLLRSCDVTTTR